MITAWWLTNDGLVDGILGIRRAGWSDCIWAVPLSLATGKVLKLPDMVCAVRFLVEDKIVTIVLEGNTMHSYNSGTGELLEPTQALSVPPFHYYNCQELLKSLHYHHCYNVATNNVTVGNSWPVSFDSVQERWVNDSKGKHQMWIPLEWRMNLGNTEQFYNITILWCTDLSGTRIIMF